jgi:hypothetical protein
MNVYRVWYWDPCNGINGRSADKGMFSTREAAQKYINDRVGEPGSARRLNPDNWERDSYTIQEVPVHGES